MRLYGAVLLIAFSALLLSGCFSTGQKQTEKVKVVASIYPIYDFAKKVGGERASVSLLIPYEVEPHAFEPSPSSMKLLSDADIFLLNGAGMESPWAENLIEGLGNKRLLVADTSKGIRLKLAEKHSHHHHPENGHGFEESATESHEHELLAYDPHIWLSPPLAKKQVENIRDALVKADPEGKAYYEANTKAYLEKLDLLDSKFRALMGKCKKKDIFITHATLGYFCESYGCRQVPIEGLGHHSEPSPAEFASLISHAKEQNVSAVFSESKLNPKIAQAISNEIGASVLVLNTAHTISAEEEAMGADYIYFMEKNLEALKKGLECG